ncbi:MAG: hypothetical protein LUM44_09930 [Pyrinomonadaceae bacterium]|nr:hypothetical protein [Pyrinomonadaceae bacterium]
MIKRLFGALLGLFTHSNLKSLTSREQIACDSVNPYRNGRFTFGGRSNGASRKRKSNRLHLSRKTRNKNRRNN